MTDVQKAHDLVLLAKPTPVSKKSRSSLSPQLRIEPASEWSSNTISALDSTEKEATTSPGPELPGGYPYTPSVLEPGPSFEEIRDTAKEYLCAAGEYVPSQDDMRRMAQNAGTTVRCYFPNGVAAYLGPVSTQEPVVASPIEESETTPTTAGSFVLINRGNNTVTTETRGHHEVKHELEVGSSTGAESRKLDATNELSIPDEAAASLANGQADSDASTKTQPGSLAAASRREGIANGTATPYSYRAAASAGNTIGGLASDLHTTSISTPPTPGNMVNVHPQRDGRTNDDRTEVHRRGGAAASPKASTAKSSLAGSGPRKPDASTEKAKEDRNKVVRKRSGKGTGMKENDVKQPKGASEVTGVHLKQEKTKNIDQMEHDDLNTNPRTLTPGKEGSQSVPVEERRQDNLNRDEDYLDSPTGGFASSGIKGGSIPKGGDEVSVPKPKMNKVYSNTATTGHDDMSESPVQVAESRFSGPLPLQTEGPSDQGDSKIIEQPQHLQPLERLHELHTSRSDAQGATNGKRSNPSIQGDRQGRQKGGFLNKIKGWSKRLSQDKKGQNGVAGNH